MVDRRSFLKQTVAAPILAPVTLALAQDRVSPIGLQLYTVRGRTTEGFRENPRRGRSDWLQRSRIGIRRRVRPRFRPVSSINQKGAVRQRTHGDISSVVVASLAERWDESA